MTDYTLEDTLHILFTTRAFATGIPTVLAGSPVVSAYENEGLTQLTAGITLGVDHDGVVGLNLLTIIAAAASGYESGKDYGLVITTGTVDSVSVVGEVVGDFTLGRSAAAVDLANGTDGLTALKTGIDDIPTTAEFEARTILAASYFDPAADAVANVTLVATTTTNTDMRGTDSALLAASINLTGGAVDTVTTVTTTTTNSDMRGTDSAALASVATEARLAELDAGNVPTDLSDIQGATFATGTDSLEAIRNRGDAAWTTGAGGSDRLLLVDTTIATLASQISFTLTAGSADNDAYNNCTIVIEDVSTATQKAIGMVLAYVGSTKTVTLKEALAFTIATTDKVYILAENSLKSTVANRQLDVTATGAAGIDWANVENPTTALDLSGTDIQLVDTTTVNTDMRGTDSAALATALATAQLDLDTITDVDGVLLGAAGVDLIWDEVLTGGTHNVTNSSGRRLRQIQENLGYEGGAIWIDTINGVAGTEDFENGTVENPVDNLADANTLATSLGLTTFRVESGSSITFVATQAGQVFIGINWTVALGGQSIVGSMLHGATVSGVAAGVGTMQMFRNCTMNTVTHIKNTHIIGCAIAGTQTVGEAGDYFLDQCFSAIAGTATWIWEFGDAIGSTNLNLRHYSGGVQLESMGDTGTDTASIEGHGQIIEGTCTGGSVVVRGHFTLSGITNLTLVDDARYDTLQINAEVDTALSDYDGPTNAEMEARTILAAAYFDPAADTVASVTTVATTTTNTDMRGTDNAALAATAFDPTAQLTESYAANGVAPTTVQLQFAIHQMLMQFGIAGTSLTVRKLDDSTTAFVVTLDDATNPTDAKRV